MRRSLRKGIAAVAASVVLGLAGTVVMAEPAHAAAPAGCDPNEVCVYADINFNHGDPGSAPWIAIPVEWLYDCKPVRLVDGWATSFYNNTRFAFQLWNAKGLGSRSMAGTMAGFKGYGYLSAEFNDRVDMIVSPGCQ